MLKAVLDTVGELEEARAALEASRRELSALRSQDVMPTPSATPTGNSSEFGNGVAARENFSKANCQLEAGLEEAKVLFLLTVLVWRGGATLVS